ncbi:aldehyde dehydrogenase [Agrobacterium tumefaciens]|uniref:Aldehyde dehydrogenase n=2 Tax=Agrobacterium fabrum TaxID=1176649 RepID=Q7D3N3_AGRFC|nr:aldehyde dehydrogenase family protein [Agrobacterium fabrum]KEY54275.1 aldehyde dehydrogenase [Agrobacterium tumefaciens]AAK90575.2 aldehyde dehydrogenase [Agrobacterium fabrum str. C58]KJX90301.1 aldehyde dehydrogenase family protein [Agrobacterium tumefaciens]MCX2875408.1 aldehyde dehydrogenase family protein [Agrobacterium fabrum]NMV70688.1 aldehyde dehydrogenase family protein [Agrobacterium fabrum]
MTTFSASNWIDGTFVSSSKRGRSIDPATYETIGDYPDDGGAAAQSAIEAAKRAFRGTAWRDDAELRARVLDQMASAIERNRERLIDILSLENGKLLGEAALEIDGSPSKLRYWAAMARTEAGRAKSPKPGSLSVILRQPMGVAGIIVPWNSPVILSVRSFAPALAAGCTVVVKMPGQTAQVGSVITEVLAEATDLPEGVVNMFVESGADGAALLVESPDVPTISFTGSTQTGRTIGAIGAKRMKRFGLELGGKTPMIVFDDADLEAMLPVLEKALTIFAGQFCMTGSRLLVHSSIYELVRDRLAERLRAVKVGPASDPASDMGPLIDKENVARVDSVVKDALSKGATVVVRGGPVPEGPLAKGAFFRPSMLEVFDNSLPIVQQETFGPVITIQRFSDEREAVVLANDNDYGLSASVWTRDLDRSLRVAQALEAGSVFVNDWAKVYDGTEEGGFKQSGLGRLNGVAAIEDFIEYKQVALKPGLLR